MTVSDDDDNDAVDAQQQIERDAKLALALQCEANINYAVAQREEMARINDSMDGVEVSLASSEARQLHEEFSDAATKEQGKEEYREITSTSVDRNESFETADEGDEEELSDESYFIVSQDGNSSGVLISDEEKKASSPVLISDGDTKSSDARSSDISSSYAAVASAARGDSDEQVADGVGVVPSVSHLQPDESISSEPSVSTLGGRPSSLRRWYFYDILHPEHGDSVFQALFGQYGDIDPLILNITPHKGRRVNIDTLAMNPRVLSLAAIHASLGDVQADPKLQLECFVGVENKPLYQKLGVKGPLTGRTFETAVQHPFDDNVIFVGSGKSQLESEEDAARKILDSLLTHDEIAQRARNLTISFRAAAAKLPFCLRFQLERVILSDASLRIKKRPKGCNAQEVEKRKQDVIFLARKVMLVYIQVVLPPLLDIDWSIECGDELCFTLIELFAGEVWESLVAVKEAIKKGSQVNFFASDVQVALDRARSSLRHAESVCGATEAQLSRHAEKGEEGYSYVETIRKRSLWPVATYSCRFEFNGVLVPTDYQIYNKFIPRNTFVQPQTRRAMRETGWPVRDRFLLMSSVKFYQVFQQNLVDWLQENPTLCNREYVYLFDKGTGKPSIWLYSPPTEGSRISLSRNALLESFGCFDGVASTKLGDRISLAFTQTTPIDEIPLDCIVAEPELVRNGYRFSDGCGVMGPGIARKVKEVLRLREEPGAIQIRMGGVKGMLSYKHDYPENKIGLRPSMVKFRSNHRILEVKQVAIVNMSPPLFSQLLLIMHHQGIPNRILLGLQAKACAEMSPEYENVVDEIADDFEYTRKVVKHGRKLNGQPFSPKEFEELRNKMTEAKTRVNLRCDARMMYGVVDEHGILEEGQVLVGNGLFEGSVLISRSPCLMPGDIQKAVAISGRSGSDRFAQTYSMLKDVIVFSSKGQRPLADCLGGGDLDGDQFLIIREGFENMFQSVEAHDYGSQQSDTIGVIIDVCDCFSVPVAAAPELTGQLSVLRELMKLGDIVSYSSDAWFRVADVEGPGSLRAVSMANLHQHALDARKLAFQVDENKLKMMDHIRRKLDAPHWRGSGAKCRVSNSILGILYNIWDSWIRDLEAAEGRRSREYGRFSNDFLDELNSQIETDTVASSESECIICFDTGTMSCSLCGGTVWVCSDECRRRHCSEAGHTRGSARDSLDQASLLGSVQESGESFSLMSSAMEDLLNVTFGRTRPSCTGMRTIDFRSLTEADLMALSKMVLAEFLTSLKESIEVRRAMLTNDTPHENDVFLMDSGELAVCRRYAGGDLMWFDQDNNHIHLEDVLYNRRVASLSGACRILESLMVKPAAGSLMDQAMKRDVVAVTVAARDFQPLDSHIFGYLNESQRQVVEAVLSTPSGIIAVQGPPVSIVTSWYNDVVDLCLVANLMDGSHSLQGCGKSSTIVEIVSAVGRGVIVTAPSNAAVANLARKLVSTGQFKVQDVVVWGENCDDSVHFLNPVLRHKRWTTFWSRYQKLEDMDEKKKVLRDFALWLQLDASQAKLSEIASLARLPAEDFNGKRAMAAAKVLLCTLNTAGSPKLRSTVQFKFDLILLDEASQAPEAEFYILATFPGVKRIVVVGDPRQLPATVVHEGCQDAGYADSFLSHVLEFQPEKVHLLNVQYRMDPEILQFSNESFYASRVISDENVLDRKPLVNSPFLFIDTSGIGSDVEQKVHTSWKNECEAVVIKSILSKDEDIRRVQSQVVGARTIVITPYDAQARFLRGELKKIKSLRSWDVATVDSFQGKE